MIDQVRALLAQQHVQRAVIIDDAYDDRPKSGDIEDAEWDRFFDDLTPADDQHLGAAYGQEAYDSQDTSELRRNALFVNAVWAEKAQIAAARALFGDFEQRQQTKRAELEPLRTLLIRDLGLACDVFGRDEAASVGDADIIFLDLFLGLLEREDAVNRAIARVKGIVDQRRAAPPNVVLLSASNKLMEVGPRLRDEAELLGCQFRMVRKNELADTDGMAERLYDLVRNNPDALRINAFLLAWNAALDGAKARFLKSIRTLDLADYANLQSLVLDAEEEPIGDYVLDLYDLHLHHELEGDEALVRSAKALNEIKWEEYPQAQFMPSDELIKMMDGAIFHNEVRTRIEGEITNDDRKVRLGDVFLGPAPTPPAAAPAPPVVPAQAPPEVAEPGPPAAAGPDQVGAAAGEHADTPPAPQRAFVVLSQACDLQHAHAEQVLLMRGTVHPYSSKRHHQNRQKTPVMKVGEFRYSVDWDVVAPETWEIQKLPEKVQGGFRRVRRFRTPFALKLQQDFVGNLGRVGTLTPVPGQASTALRVYLRLRGGTMRLLIDKSADSADAAYLVGRNAKGDAVEMLLLSPALQDEFRRTLRDVTAADVPVGGAKELREIRDDPAFYRRFKSGLTVKREKPKGTRPFADTTDDVVQIVAGRVCTNGGAAPTGFAAIIVEMDLD
jgi:hypothetical protein